MRHIKSERLKKLETELTDLQQWLKLGLVPKKDIEKHKEEIHSVEVKIQEERERLQFLRESGDMEEYIVPKRAPTRTGYTEMPSLPDMDIGDSHSHVSDSQFEIESETSEGSSSIIEEKEDGGDESSTAEIDDREEESYFSDKNRWRRGGIVDPDANEW